MLSLLMHHYIYYKKVWNEIKNSGKICNKSYQNSAPYCSPCIVGIKILERVFVGLDTLKTKHNFTEFFS